MKYKEALTFDDVSMVPVHSEIRSRKAPSTDVNLGQYKLKIPIIAAPMNTVTGHEMAKSMSKIGADSVIHRYMEIREQVEEFKNSIVDDKHVQPFVAVGAAGDFKERAKALFDAGVRRFCVDIANGHSLACIEATEHLANKYGAIDSSVSIMAGNVVTGDGARRLEEAGANVIRVGVGSGCFGPGTRILMSNGSYKNIEDINIHDRVINRDGKPVDVIATRFSGIKKVKKYKSNLFYKETYATGDHKHWVGDYGNIKDINKKSLRDVLNSGDRFKWRPLEECSYDNSTFLIPNSIKFELNDSFELKMDDYALSRRSFTGGLKEGAIVGPQYNLGYIFGTFLGDGYARVKNYNRKMKNGKVYRNQNSTVYWSFGKNEMPIAEKLQSALSDVFGFNAKIVESENMITVYNRSNILARLLSTFGKRKNKKLPDHLMCSNLDYLSGIYDGLVDSDGYKSKDGRTGFTNTSVALMEQCMLISYIVNGYYPSITICKPTAGNLKGCDLESCSESYVARTTKRPEFNIVHGENQVNRFYGYEDVDVAIPTYDIEVDCPTHSFIANGVAVHNSVCKTRIVTGFGVPQLTAIEWCKDGVKSASIVADGGIRQGGDYIKAISIGADAVMIGGILAGTNQSPGEFRKSEDGIMYKYIHGMASIEGRKGWFDDSDTTFVPEGDSMTVMYKGDAIKIVNDLNNSLKVGMSFANANILDDLRKNALFVRISDNGRIEGTPNKRMFKK